jgi:hypothetical protein
MPIGSLERDYSALTQRVKTSSVAHDALMYIYPISNDNAFRKNNPLVDLPFDQRLSEFQSVYDHSLPDTAGDHVSFRAFKNKALWVPHYVIVDRTGKIINYDAPQASVPELEQLLDKLLDRR